MPPDLQASEHLRRLHMKNMVATYCKRVQPEWKKQVCGWKEEANISSASFLYDLFFCFSRCSWRSQPVRFSRIRKTATRRVLGGCSWTPGWVCADTCNCYLTNGELEPGNTQSTMVSLSFWIEREQINLKVAQTLGNDKVQVGFRLSRQTWRVKKSFLICTWCFPVWRSGY